MAFTPDDVFDVVEKSDVLLNKLIDVSNSAEGQTVAVVSACQLLHLMLMFADMKPSEARLLYESLANQYEREYREPNEKKKA